MSLSTTACRSGETDARSRTARIHPSRPGRRRGRGGGPVAPGVPASRSAPLIAGDSIRVEDRRRDAARDRRRGRGRGPKGGGREDGRRLLRRGRRFGTRGLLRFRGRCGGGRYARDELRVVDPALQTAPGGLHVGVSTLELGARDLLVQRERPDDLGGYGRF